MITVLDHPEAPETVTVSDPAPARPRGGGPRTPEGRDRSRRNSLKHGLCAKVILPDDLADELARRTAELAEEYAPRSLHEEFLVGQKALAAVRLDRCATMAIADLGRCVERASLCWESDRRMAVEDLGARLPKDPPRVAWGLRRSRQGADWLIERWEGLGESLQSNGGWTDAQRRLAFDLLGVPLDLRDGSRRVPPEGDTRALAALVAREVARLREHQEAVLDALDEADRSMTLVGMPLEEDAATARLRKYEASCRRALLWADSELRRAREESPTADDPAGPLTPAPEPARDLSKASQNYLAKRSVAVPLTIGAIRVAEAAAARTADDGEASITLAATPVSAAIRPAAAPRNRRERRAQAKRARQKAR